MIINSKERLETVLEAEQEFRELRDAAVPDAFYQEKIGRLWNRATRSPAYWDIGAFSREAFDALPLTPKERLKADPWSFVAAPLRDASHYYETTGTTGTATPTPRLAEDVIWNTVSVAGAWRHVLGGEERVISLLPSDIVPVGDLVASVCGYSGVPYTRAYPFATGICDWDRITGLWSTLRPTVVFMAPGVALQATRLLRQRGLLEQLAESVRSIMLLGEVSVPAMRRRLGTWWGADVYDASYGSTETGTLAATCPSDRLHLLTAAHHVELASAEGRPLGVAEGQGRLVVTPLNLYARPLLRYDTGDEVVVSQGCDCGLVSATVTVLGRATDGLRVRGGALSPHLIEEIVYGRTTATGYVLEADRAGTRFRLILERFTRSDRDGEEGAVDAVRAAFEERGLACDQVVFVNSLPAITKSGGSQKSWKRSNIRVVDAW